jgi:hypothetical protein
MKIAYLVLAHNNPAHLQRTIQALAYDDCAFFIHVDRKSDINAFSGLAGRNVFFAEKRIAVYWGEYSQVQAILSLLRQASRAPVAYDYFVLISGSDYPLRSGRYIQEFLAANQGWEFMNMVKMPAAGKPISRINTLRFQSNKPIRRFGAKVLARLGLAQRDYRKYLGGLEPYAGSTWWALTRNATAYVLEFVENNQEVVKFFENVFAADEAFFHTILGNSPFKFRMRRNLLYEDTSVQGPHPALISERHVALLEANDKVLVEDVFGSGEALFARKFSEDRLDLLQRIDAMIERKERQRRSPGSLMVYEQSLPRLKA